MKAKFIIIGLAMGSLGFSQEFHLDTIDLNKFEEFPSTTVSLDTIKVDTTIVEKKKIESKVCGKNTGKNLPCKNKTKHESGSCHHHRD